MIEEFQNTTETPKFLKNNHQLGSHLLNVLKDSSDYFNVAVYETRINVFRFSTHKHTKLKSQKAIKDYINAVVGHYVY